MTEDELREIEQLTADNIPDYADFQNRYVPRLIAEVRKLKGLLDKATDEQAAKHKQYMEDWRSLRSENDRLRAALAPFAFFDEEIHPIVDEGCAFHHEIECDDVLRVREVLSGNSAKQTLNPRDKVLIHKPGSIYDRCKGYVDMALEESPNTYIVCIPIDGFEYRDTFKGSELEPIRK